MWIFSWVHSLSLMFSLSILMTLAILSTLSVVSATIIVKFRRLCQEGCCVYIIIRKLWSSILILILVWWPHRFMIRRLLHSIVRIEVASTVLTTRSRTTVVIIIRSTTTPLIWTIWWPLEGLILLIAIVLRWLKIILGLLLLLI